MSIEIQTVHDRIAPITLNVIECNPVIRRLESTESFLIKDLTLYRQFTDQRFCYVERHARESPLCIVSRQVLMLMIVIIGELNLTNAIRTVVSVHL